MHCSLARDRSKVVQGNKYQIHKTGKSTERLNEEPFTRESHQRDRSWIGLIDDDGDDSEVPDKLVTLNDVDAYPQCAVHARGKSIRREETAESHDDLACTFKALVTAKTGKKPQMCSVRQCRGLCLASRDC